MRFVRHLRSLDGSKKKLLGLRLEGFLQKLLGFSVESKMERRVGDRSMLLLRVVFFYASPLP